MAREYLPPTLGYGAAHARAEWQGGPNACKHFGVTAALEFMAARAGVPQQFSVRFLWWFTRGMAGVNSIEAVVELLNRVGVCADQLCPYVASTEPPYGVQDIDTPPTLEALLDAQARGIKLATERIAGKTEVMRALAQGWGVITVRTYPGGGEHAECLIDYDQDLGVLVCGSTGAIYWEDWSSLAYGGSFTQVHRITEAPWGPVPHPDYVEADQPTFENGVLTIPSCKFYGGFGIASMVYRGIECMFSDYGQVQANDPAVGREPVWFASRRVLHLPVLMLGGVRYTRVSLINPSFSSWAWASIDS